MASGRNFTTIPCRAISDSALTGLDLRVLAVISKYDGMSLWPGRGGAGCFAKHSKLAAEVGVDVTSFSRALNRLLDAGYIRKEIPDADKRRFTLRVVPDTDRHGPIDLSEILDESANNCGGIVDGQDDNPAEKLDEPANQIVDMGDPEIVGFLPVSADPYKNHSLDSAEAGKDSAEAARLEGASHVQADFSNWQIICGLPSNFHKLAVGGQLGAFERALRKVDTNRIPTAEAKAAENWLLGVMDDFCLDDVIGPWAQRLFEHLPWERAA